MKVCSVAIGALALMISGCVTAPTPKQQPPGGYEAVRFRSAFSAVDHSINTYTFTAGTTLVSDRQSDAGQIYCGTVAINEQVSQGCFGFDGSNIIIGPESTLKRAERPVPPGTIERTRMPL